VAICSLHYDQVTGLDALTGRVLVYSLSGILETYLEVVLELFLTDSCKPVIYFKLAAALTIGAVHLTAFIALYYATARTVISLRFHHIP
jgi:hypothetical protein